MDRRFISASITVAMVFAMMGLTMLIAPIAGAQSGVRPAVENFHPEDVTATGTDLDKNQISDGFDGVDSTAHLTAVADQNASQVTWYLCGPTGATANPTTPTASNSACELIGEDTSGVTRTQADGLSTDVAFEFNWNIPSTRDETTYTIATRACNSTPTASESNCHYDFNGNIYLDDSSTVGGNPPQLGQNGQAIPAGEIMGFCTTPTSGTCFSTNTAFVADGHGAQAPQNAVWVFRTSPDLTAAGLCIDQGANAGNDPDTCDVTATATLLNTTTTYKEWASTPAGVATGDADFGIAGQGTTLRSAAQCTGTAPLAGTTNCMLDEHYKQVVAGSATGGNSTAQLTFQTTGASCTSQDNEEYNRNGTTEVVLGCIVDQFGRSLSSQTVLFTTSGTAGFISSCGNPSNTGANGTTPTGFGTTSTGCTTTTDVNGQATAAAVNTPSAAAIAGGQDEGTPGTQVVTFCAGSQNAAGTGCTASAASDTVTKHWEGNPAHIHLVFAGTGDAADPCHTGDQFKTNEVGDTDDLLACVFNQDDVATSTVMTSEPSGTWSISFTRSSCTGVTFDGNPPTETDADGTATVTVRATGDGTCDINANLKFGSTTVSTATANKTVTEASATTECNDNVDNDSDGDIDFPNDQGCSSLNDDSEDSDNQPGDTTGTACQDKESDPNVIVGTDGADVLQGTANRDIICGLGGDDVISGRAGNDLIQGNAGSDTAGGGGGKDNVSGNGGRDNVSGNKGNDAVKGAGGGDTLKGNGGIDSITGGAGGDSLQGGDGPDILKGGPGDDTLRGGAGDDALNGGGGTDQCFGNAGNDDVTGCE